MSGRGEYDSGFGYGSGCGLRIVSGSGREGGDPHLQLRWGCDRVHFRVGSFDKMLMPRWVVECRGEEFEFAGRDAQKIQYDGHFRW